MRELTFDEVHFVSAGMTQFSNFVGSLLTLGGTFIGIATGIHMGLEVGGICGILAAVILTPVCASWGFMLGCFAGIMITLPIEFLFGHK